jgi:hypothetical protein
MDGSEPPRKPVEVLLWKRLVDRPTSGSSDRKADMDRTSNKTASPFAVTISRLRMSREKF